MLLTVLAGVGWGGWEEDVRAAQCNVKDQNKMLPFADSGKPALALDLVISDSVARAVIRFLVQETCPLSG